MDGLCRVCATEDKPMKSIFDSDGVQHKLKIQIEVCLHIVVKEDGPFPLTVCEPCVEKLKTSYELVESCKKGQTELQRRLKIIEKQHQVRGIHHDACYKTQNESTLNHLPNVDPMKSDTSDIMRNNEDCSSLLILADTVVKQATIESSPSSSSTTLSKLTCEFCKKIFNHRGDLNKHIRSHTGEKPFECNTCGKRFTHGSNLLRHGKLHSGERPFSCKYCKRKFSRSDKFTSHNCKSFVPL